MPLASQAIGLRLNSLRRGRFGVKNIDRAEIAFRGYLIMPVHKRMVLRPVGGHDRHQAEEANPERPHRNRMPLQFAVSERTR